MSEWKKVTGDQGKTVRWTAEPKNDKEREKTVYVGDVVEGVYVERRDNVGMNASTIFVLKSKEHGLLNVWTTTLLEDLMNKVPVGSEVRISYGGRREAKTSGRTFDYFEVEAREVPMEKVEASKPDVPAM